ncbi:mitotic-spindle organizing protein 2A-like isoform X2 [Corvus moneduloides]|uniref:mitotic-spindle organizing protein 2A-like isoform X2 n=1 Tax=Corvus moneduloides TaxID=1196302 RepID=UPI0013637244|nr:mitotic-spindle organizing protein 2A-like isoform X2 [Corvus moneduloides]
MSEAAAGMAAAAAPMAEARLRRKQLLSAEEAELFELAQAAGSGLDPEVFRVLLDLLRMNVAPLAVFQVLKSMCAGQRLPPGPEGGPAAPIPADTRGLSLDVWLLRQQGTDTGRKELCIAGVRMLSCPGKLSQTPVPVGKATEPITSHGLCQRFPGEK